MQILVNFISNSVKFSSKGGKVTVLLKANEVQNCEAYSPISKSFSLNSQKLRNSHDKLSQ